MLITSRSYRIVTLTIYLFTLGLEAEVDELNLATSFSVK